MSKRVFLEPAWKTHSFYQGLIASPPQGYEFVTLDSSHEKIIKVASRLNLSYSLLSAIDSFVPVNLVKANLERLKKIPPDVDLTYSYDHMVFRKEPWVIDLEYLSLLLSYNAKHFRRYRGVVEKALGSEYCRKIICETEAAKKTVLLNLDCARFDHKLETLPPAVRKKDFTKQFTNGKVKLLFVGSANLVGKFDIKGGREALEAFNLLNKKYDNLELVVRSDVPRDVRRDYSNRGNVRIIEQSIPWAMLEQEFRSADIFLLPVHSTPFSVFLDAMSYELPIVTIDAWANSEIVDDGKTGLVTRTSERIPYYMENLMPIFGAPEFLRAIRTPDPKVAQELADKTSILIENKDLRREMGRKGRREVERGRFSIERRTERLKRILDEAIA